MSGPVKLEYLVTPTYAIDTVTERGLRGIEVIESLIVNIWLMMERKTQYPSGHGRESATIPLCHCNRTPGNISQDLYVRNPRSRLTAMIDLC